MYAQAAATGLSRDAVRLFVATRMYAQAAATGLSRDAVVRDVILASQPSKRLIDAGDVGALAAFLAGEHGASITGAALNMDGGWAAR